MFVTPFTFSAEATIRSLKPLTIVPLGGDELEVNKVDAVFVRDADDWSTSAYEAHGRLRSTGERACIVKKTGERSTLPELQQLEETLTNVVRERLYCFSPVVQGSDGHEKNDSSDAVTVVEDSELVTVVDVMIGEVPVQFTVEKTESYGGFRGYCDVRPDIEWFDDTKEGALTGVVTVVSSVLNEPSHSL